MATVVVLPDPEWADRDRIIGGVAGAIDVHGDSATEMCADLLRHAPQQPLVIVARGGACAALPAVALAQRTAHRRVGGYLLVDPKPPAGTDVWPDAPVHVITTDEQIARTSTLRGWSVSAEDVVTAIARLVAESG